MKIQVVGFDPSLTHWGIAVAMLDLTTGILDDPILQVIEPIKPTGKQLRQNSTDLAVAKQLSRAAFLTARASKAVFVECPVGSQSARSMASYGICMGILGAIQAAGIPLIEVTATEVKLALSGKSGASKPQMIAAGVALYPNANWPRAEKTTAKRKKGEIVDAAEHVADAIGAIHAGVNTPMFQNLLRLYKD